MEDKEDYEEGFHLGGYGHAWGRPGPLSVYGPAGVPGAYYGSVIGGGCGCGGGCRPGGCNFPPPPLHSTYCAAAPFTRVCGTQKYHNLATGYGMSVPYGYGYGMYW